MNLFVTAFQVCKNVEDAKDVVQDTFIAYYTSDLQYNDEQHIRAWLFRITVNKAKDVKKSFWHRNKMPLEDYRSKRKRIVICLKQLCIFLKNIES